MWRSTGRRRQEQCVSAAGVLLLATVVLPGCQASGGAAGLGDVPQAVVSALNRRGPIGMRGDEATV